VTEEQKEEILNEIRKSHGIAMNSNDPTFAVITALEIVARHYLKEVDLLITKQTVTIQDSTELYLSKVKELAEVKISAATNNTLDQLKQFKIEAKQDLTTHARDDPSSSMPIPIIYWILLVMTGVIGYMSALLILT